LLGLEEEAEAITDPFLKKGLQLVVDGTDIEMIRNIMETDIIGTVLGLIHALAAMGEGNADAMELAGAIATAFIATFYGISFANIIFLPIAFKLKQNSQQEVLLREVMLEGILAISAGDNPRIVEEKLKAFLPPRMKLDLEAQKGQGEGKEEEA
jgi:chemotaxis protein MotA